MHMAGAITSVYGSLTEQQKILAGGVSLVLGIVMLAALAFAGVTSTPTQVGLGVVGVACAVVGTLLLGTSEERDQIV